MTDGPRDGLAPVARRGAGCRGAGRLEPRVWIAPAVAVVLFVFGYSMVELVKPSLRHKRSWSASTNFRLTFTRSGLPDGARAQRTTAARGARARRPRAAPFGAAVRRAAGLALPPRGGVPPVRSADPGGRRHLRPDAAAQRARQPVAAGVRARRARAGLARAAELGAVDDDRRHRLEGARLRRHALPRAAALAAGRDVRGGAHRRRAVLPPAPLRDRPAARRA